MTFPLGFLASCRTKASPRLKFGLPFLTLAWRRPASTASSQAGITVLPVLTYFLPLDYLLGYPRHNRPSYLPRVCKRTSHDSASPQRATRVA